MAADWHEVVAQRQTNIQMGVGQCSMPTLYGLRENRMSPYLERRTSRQFFNLRVISDLLRVKHINAGQCVFFDDFRLSAFADRGKVLCWQRSLVCT